MSEIDVYPIDEVESDVVKVNILFPDFVDSERIGLNVAHLEKLCRIAGISELTIKSHSGSRNSGQPVILGVQKDGTAIGGFEKAKSSTESQFSERDKNGYRISKWTKVGISIDIDFINNEISESGDDIKSVSQWIEKLEKEISNNVFTAGIKVLSQKNPPQYLIAEMAFYMIFILSHLDLYSGANSGSSSSLLIWLWAFYVAKVVMAKVDNAKLKDIRLSVLNYSGVEVDRTAVFIVMANIKSLVKEIVPKEE